jgi:hypothetical protein
MIYGNYSSRAMNDHGPISDNHPGTLPASWVSRSLLSIHSQQVESKRCVRSVSYLTIVEPEIRHNFDSPSLKRIENLMPRSQKAYRCRSTSHRLSHSHPICPGFFRSLSCADDGNCDYGLLGVWSVDRLRSCTRPTSSNASNACLRMSSFCCRR